MMLVETGTCRILLANPAWYKLTGYSAEDISNCLKWTSMVPLQNLERVHKRAGEQKNRQSLLSA